MTTLSVSAEVFACHSAACRPPTSGGTGGSGGRSATNAMIDRAMGIKRQATLKEVAEDHMRTPPMRDISNATQGHGPAATPNPHLSKVGKLKVGSQVTLKDEDGNVMGTVRRATRGSYEAKTPSGTLYGFYSNAGKTPEDAVKRLEAMHSGTTRFTARATSPAARTDSQKAFLKRDSKMWSDEAKTTHYAKLMRGHSQKLIGTSIKSSDVNLNLGKDRMIVKGQRSDFTAFKTHNSHGQVRYVVRGLRDSQTTFKTQAAAKAAVAKLLQGLNDHVKVKAGEV